MSVMHPEYEVLDLTDVVGDLEIPCEWRVFHCHKGSPARWVVWLVKCPSCGWNCAPRTVCNDCKNYAVFTDECAMCTHCDGIVQPFRKIIARTEPLNRRPV
jgi:hypothetical protein